MMKSEFEEIIGRTVKEEEYDAIEFVYTWHPAISDTDGKQQIADLYKAGGMAVINDMSKRALMARDIEAMISKCQTRMNFLKDKLVELKHSPDVDEFEILFKTEEVSNRA